MAKKKTKFAAPVIGIKEQKEIIAATRRQIAHEIRCVSVEWGGDGPAGDNVMRTIHGVLRDLGDAIDPDSNLEIEGDDDD